MDIQERIKKIEEEIRKTPYHKATEHHIGRLKARLAKLKIELLRNIGGRGGGGPPAGGFAIKKSGDASVVLVGFPSVGKSTLLNKLTSAHSKTALYPFSTVKVIPGMMAYNGAKIQILDIPGLLTGASEGRGRGKQILSAVRGSDLIILMASVEDPELLKITERELKVAGIRLNQSPSQVLIKKKNKGGVRVVKGDFQVPSREIIKGIAKEFRLTNVEIIIKEDMTAEDLIDVLAQNRVYLPAMKVVNKIDLRTRLEISELRRALGDKVIFISAEKEIGLENLKVKIWEKLNLMRVYLTSERNKMAADYEEPLILKKGLNVLEAAEKISGELKEEINGALMWGKSVRFPGQKVSLKHQLEDGDVVYWVKR